MTEKRGVSGGGSPPAVYAAIDLGASSGRVVCGHFDGSLVELEDIHRFPNRPVRLPDGLRWNLLHLFTEAVCALRGRRFAGVGIDTWGVDYALLDERDRVLGLPFHYRDERTDGAQRVEGYEITGIQHMPINTVYQLLADDRVSAASRIALVPDLLAYWLSGELANERTNASTTGLLDARTGEWAHPLIERLGLPARPFGALVEPGTLLGPALDHHDVDAPVYTVASHDTASAYVAAPLRDEHSAILSSGTWSLLGLELPGPVFSDDALTNERGVDGTIRLLKNVMGLWLEQECARVWGADFPSLQRAAREVKTEVPVFDPDDERFLHGGDMPALIAEVIGRDDLTRGELVRSIYVSLACKYKVVLERLEAASGRSVRTIHVIGGGARNELLCQLTADMTGREVLAGPVEATALGNVLVQARAAGELGSLADMRAVSAASFVPAHYEPSTSKESLHA
ncbi:rhamnulokinase [Solirubrobacter sp. CPCC 204708]|uniref:Rhamnulokinase n=1 Tax=Solirubrobacter deserti TaxID=2282478 RepID=A0ABT4RUT9_9ACTN|nr:rhamnulokinase family protein [Solirubrobacter deserti]MBE2320736.1 rhamnulokinase [Solirubrobacter deserti]MDA0142347.1 rhamnulokinase [Solirubrobacter deserti]